MQEIDLLLLIEREFRRAFLLTSFFMPIQNPTFLVRSWGIRCSWDKRNRRSLERFVRNCCSSGSESCYVVSCKYPCRDWLHRRSWLWWDILDYSLQETILFSGGSTSICPSIGPKSAEIWLSRRRLEYLCQAFCIQQHFSPVFLGPKVFIKIQTPK